uniref:ATP synthase complex subunit 8 n=1 Tax=Epistrophe lamellata TaxID=2892951 RepID=A0A8K1RD02_9MUSC|nr:ATP synthase F0 subunit 8 [Sphaerophoria philanthus]UEK75600.1 ATP synthase F0 subunit 8 [Epistrophe lamellata]WCJ53216.1 ATP synthase F0 subunit 8 [Sphaerophoria philanthus]
MPQMSPISWLSLFIFFSIIFILFNMMNYFIYTPNSSKSKKLFNINKISMNWKW